MRTNEYRAILNNKITINVASDIAKSMGQYFTLIGFPNVFDKNKALAPLITVEVSVAVIVGLILALGCNYLLKRVEKLRVYLTLTNAVTTLGLIGLLVMIPCLSAVDKNDFSNLHEWNFFIYLLGKDKAQNTQNADTHPTSHLNHISLIITTITTYAMRASTLITTYI